jgi:hypothetical protein
MKTSRVDIMGDILNGAAGTELSLQLTKVLACEAKLLWQAPDGRRLARPADFRPADADVVFTAVIVGNPPTGPGTTVEQVDGDIVAMLAAAWLIVNVDADRMQHPLYRQHASTQMQSRMIVEEADRRDRHALAVAEARQAARVYAVRTWMLRHGMSESSVTVLLPTEQEITGLDDDGKLEALVIYGSDSAPNRRPVFRHVIAAMQETEHLPIQDQGLLADLTVDLADTTPGSAAFTAKVGELKQYLSSPLDWVTSRDVNRNARRARALTTPTAALENDLRRKSAGLAGTELPENATDETTALWLFANQDTPAVQAAPLADRLGQDWRVILTKVVGTPFVLAMRAVRDLPSH